MLVQYSSIILVFGSHISDVESPDWIQVFPW
jgi:hypothetical protein